MGCCRQRQLYGHLPPITKTIQVRRARHAGHCWRSKGELVSDVLLWTPTYGQAKAGRPARTYIQQLCGDTGQKTYRRRWMIGRSGERGSGISVLVARHDDDDIYIKMMYTPVWDSLIFSHWCVCVHVCRCFLIFCMILKFEFILI